MLQGLFLYLRNRFYVVQRKEQKLTRCGLTYGIDRPRHKMQLYIAGIKLHQRFRANVEVMFDL